MSSSVGSGSWALRASWRCGRSSARESLAPPSRGMLRSLLSRARSRSSCSDGGIEEPQQSRERRAERGGAGGERVEFADAEVLLRKGEVLGQLLPHEREDDPRPGERHELAWLSEQD